MEVVAILLRWMHVFAGMTLVGGLLYQRLALLPAACELADPQRAEFLNGARRRWSKLVMIAVLFLLVSGLVNLFLTIKTFKPLLEDQQLPGLYLQLFLVKFVLALVIFFFASALAGRGAATQRFRDEARRWLTITLILAVILVAISNVMRSMHTGPNVKAVIGNQ
ncbi:MAG: hypothetical protein WBF93_09445 [Pirellulales bacterium]